MFSTFWLRVFDNICVVMLDVYDMRKEMVFKLFVLNVIDEEGELDDIVYIFRWRVMVRS